MNSEEGTTERRSTQERQVEHSRAEHGIKDTLSRKYSNQRLGRAILRISSRKSMTLGDDDFNDGARRVGSRPDASEKVQSPLSAKRDRKTQQRSQK